MTVDPESIIPLPGLLAWILRQNLELMKSHIIPQNLVFWATQYFFGLEWFDFFWLCLGSGCSIPDKYLFREILDFSSTLQLNSALRVQQECCQWHPERTVERTNFDDSLTLPPLSPVLKYMESWEFVCQRIVVPSDTKICSKILSQKVVYVCFTEITHIR